MIIRLVSSLVVILLGAKLFGFFAKRLNQPVVLGELVGGVILGLGWFPFFHPNEPALMVLAELGVAILLFEIGLDSDLALLLKVGPVSFRVATVGVLVPMLLGFGVMALAGFGPLPSLLIGGALTATSIGVTARVLTDLGKLDRPEGQVILGAAVIDDVLGLIVLWVVQGIAQMREFSWGSLGRTFLTVASFTGGLLLAQTTRRPKIRQALTPVSAVLVPVFFVMTGARVDLSPFNPLIRSHGPVLVLAASLMVVAVIGKLSSGWVVGLRGWNRLAIGVGMIPRGEVGLIFAQMGLASGMIGTPLYTALIGMVMVTTLITPPWLKRVFR
jgi:Kef-type K+ transport system membrane component KefB